MSNEATTGSTAAGDTEMNRQLLSAAIRLNTLLFAGVFACVGGLFLFTVTFMSLYRGLPQPGQYLNLLGVFLPGYSVSHAGAWVGMFWGAVIGAVLAVIFYRIYARSIESQVKDYVENDRDDRDLQSIVLRLDGNYLGLAMGSIVAGGLLVTTNWLVFKGTANESVHAILLANFLPGYTVSPLGSLIGAVEMFIGVYLVCLLFSWIYNSTVVLRGR